LLLIKGSATLDPERKFKSFHASCTNKPAVLFYTKIICLPTLIVYHYALAENAQFQ